ncbi:MAG: glutathione peroxidase [Chitinophagales bacterium]|nr:glutathione peroxidase [Chitinophagales bacterium]
MNVKIILFITMRFFPLYSFAQVSNTDIYSFKVESLEGDTINFSEFKGKKILIVNVASQCMFTPQYEGLQNLYEKYKEKLVIIGFPSNDFFKQEPGNSTEIKQFCSSKYHVTFPMAAKVSVKGSSMSPVYQWLTSKKLNGTENSKVSWNFNKYLINERGEYIAHFGSKTEPLSKEITNLIEN